MADGWHLCPSASSARDILPAVVCSIIVAPALTALGSSGVAGYPAGRMACRVVGGWRSPVHPAPTVTRAGSATKPVRRRTRSGRTAYSEGVSYRPLHRRQYVTVADPYLDGTCRWWHLARPSPELLAARDDGWLGTPGVAVDLGCGLGTEIGYLAAAGWSAVGVDLSAAALHRAAQSHRGARFIQADVLGLPLSDASADLLLDRGCFHYLAPAARGHYAREARRVLKPGGRFLLRACQASAGVRNDIDQTVIEHVFGDWHLARITGQHIDSDTRRMPALIVRLTVSN
jgi:hypothetical protein